MSDEQQANLEMALEQIDDLLGTLREIDEEILGDCSGQPLQRWERLDGLRAMKKRSEGGE